MPRRPIPDILCFANMCVALQELAGEKQAEFTVLKTVFVWSRLSVIDLTAKDNNDTAFHGLQP